MHTPPLPLQAAAIRAARCAAFVCLAWAGLPAVAAEPAWAAMPAPLLSQRLPVADAPAGAWRLRAEAADFSAVDATPVRALSGDWARYHPRSGRNAALEVSRIELAASRQHWELAATLRSDILIQGSRDAFDVVHAYKQRSTPADGSAFAIDAQERGVVWAGLRGARTWAFGPDAAVPTWQLTAAATLLSVRRVQQADAQGAVRYDLLGGYAFDAQTLRQDTRGGFGGADRIDATGQGITTDLGLLWQPAERIFINLSVVDLASRLRVPGVPSETMSLSSATRGVDAEGYLDYKPLLNGRYGRSELRPRLARKWAASAGWRLEAVHEGLVAGARLEQVGDLRLPALWASLALRPGWALQLDAESRFRALGIGLATPAASVMLRTRSLPVGGSSALGWQLALHWPW